MRYGFTPTRNLGEKKTSSKAVRYLKKKALIRFNDQEEYFQGRGTISAFGKSLHFNKLINNIHRGIINWHIPHRLISDEGERKFINLSKFF